MRSIYSFVPFCCLLAVQIVPDSYARINQPAIATNVLERPRTAIWTDLAEYTVDVPDLVTIGCIGRGYRSRLAVPSRSEPE
ncbi:hypothetical protein SAMN05216559_3642 [Halomicrobium zhouii]|uniref:Uncharacterized protein n=1 Tax=Halomicrobium zhouii TaxID=767519 RepID=A0A1I6M2V5_9EURY|nr:hypothetical protein SAMN05216559_3642 [Halomicrobium zhouii]